LRKKLMAVKAWNPEPSGAGDSSPGPSETTVKSSPAAKAAPAPP
jgi:hypothetical protein